MSSAPTNAVVQLVGGTRVVAVIDRNIKGDKGEPGPASSLGLLGDGSDGAADITSNTTLTRPMNYTTLRVRSGATLFTAGNNIYCTGQLTIDNGAVLESSGSTSRNGGNASGATPGVPAAQEQFGNDTQSRGSAGGPGAISGAGTNGSAVSVSSASAAIAGGVGGSGGVGISGTAGVGGTIGLTNNRFCRVVSDRVQLGMIGTTPVVLSAGQGGSGGGGGTGNFAQSGGGGGAGGNGGRFMFIAANSIINSGTINNRGGNGGAGGAGNIAGGCGGGGGGGGGCGGIVMLAYSSFFTGNAPDVSGGAGGAGGAGVSANTNSTAGAPGSNGFVLKLNLATGVYE